ncbi:MAG: hypothetical protein E6Q97_31570 [Desulfurellales bacterium]|nr:MAG: hypothetical protein E6Q97_31570 [Desulfurellales bacterium]
MTTEYRPNIPSHAHIEAATRLGLEWRRDAHNRSEFFTRFRYVDGQIHSNFAGYSELNDYLTPASADEHTFSYRPIRPDGTPVDWEVLDAEAQYANMPAAQAQPEPRRFADVRPDRHGWRWWRVYGHLEEGTRIENQRGWFRWHARQVTDWLEWGQITGGIWFDRTVIPTDEQGNPVSWEAAGFAAEAVRGAQESVQRAANDATPARSVGDIEWTVTGQPVTRDMLVDPATGVVRSTHTAHIRQLDRLVTEAIQAGNTGSFSVESPNPPRSGQFSNNPATAPLTPENLMRQMQNYQLPAISLGMRQLHADTIDYVNAEISRAVLGDPQPAALPRFTTDELDDVDHSRTTKLDQATLRRGKLPTVEQIAKYREIRAKRTGGTVADALKESRIDCEVAQYVLERWAGGLGDAEAKILVEKVWRMLIFETKAIDTFVEVENAITQTTLDTTEPPDTAAQQARQQAEERRRRLAQVQAQIAAERATAQPQEVSEPRRFDLIEPDPHADPTTSIRAWEAHQAAAKQEKAKVAAMPAKSTAAPRKPAIEVVDAETDGLSRGDVVLALLGRAMHGGC